MITVTNRPCMRPGCHGPISLSTADNRLWCHGCNSVQAIPTHDGRVRVRLTAAEVDDLELADDDSPSQRRHLHAVPNPDEAAA